MSKKNLIIIGLLTFSAILLGGYFYLQSYLNATFFTKEDIEKYGKEEFERCIIKLAPSKKLLTYYETQYQFMYQVLEKPELYYNDNILGKFFTKDFEYR